VGHAVVVRLRGLEVQVHPPGDWVSDHVRATGEFYEAPVLDRVAAELAGRPPGVLLDVGAMIGLHTTYLAEYVPHTAIHAWEPARANLAVLLRNVTRYPSVHVHPLALSDREQLLALRSEPGNLGHTQVVAQAHDTFDAPAVPLDSYRLEEVRLVKVDVEGHEAQVLAGARATLERWRPLVVVEDWRRDLGPLLAGLGYQLVADWGEAHQTYLYAPAE
jgi:FkbM family methyltransferase